MLRSALGKKIRPLGDVDASSVRGASPTEKGSTHAGLYWTAPMIYAVGEVGSSYVKIGSTEDVKRRLCGIQGGNPREVRILATFEGGGGLEKGLHDYFSNRRVRREWFDFTGIDVKSSIKSAIDELCSAQADLITATYFAQYKPPKKSDESKEIAVDDALKAFTVVYQAFLRPTRHHKLSKRYLLQALRTAIPEWETVDTRIGHKALELHLTTLDNECRSTKIFIDGQTVSGYNWTEIQRTACRVGISEDDPEAAAVRLCQALKAAAMKQPSAEILTTRFLADELRERLGNEWTVMCNTTIGMRLSAELKRYNPECRPIQAWQNRKMQKGYRRRDFERALVRWQGSCA